MTEPDAWAEMDAWCVKQSARIMTKWEPYIMRGGNLDAPDYRLDLGQSRALHRMRSFIHGSRQAIAGEH